MSASESWAYKEHTIYRKLMIWISWAFWLCVYHTVQLRNNQSTIVQSQATAERSKTWIRAFLCVFILNFHFENLWKATKWVDAIRNASVSILMNILNKNPYGDINVTGMFTHDMKAFLFVKDTSSHRFPSLSDVCHAQIEAISFL